MNEPARRSTRPDEAPLSRLQRTTVWAGLRQGDPVEVAGTRLRSATWQFLAHVRNVATGDQWIEVVGGRAGDRTLRSFRPEQIFAPSDKTSRRRPRPSLADAPQLPLG